MNIYSGLCGLQKLAHQSKGADNDRIDVYKDEWMNNNYKSKKKEKNLHGNNCCKEFNNNHSLQ